jgi:SAM-dependent methyltransferase
MTADDRMFVFDRRAVRRHRERAAPGWPRHSFLVEEVAERLADRLLDVNRSFPLALDLGAHGGETGRRILGVKGVERVVAMDLAHGLVARADGPAVVGDEEALPFADAAFDLVVSALSLHWVNDLPGALIQIRRILKPDGMFIGAVLGGRTLAELRQSLLSAEEEIRGGAANRISPYLDVIDGAGLLQRAGFAMPVADNDARTVRYAHPLRLLAELRGMGETAAFADRSAPPLTRAILMRAMEIYVERFSDADGRVRATFEFVTLSGWSPSPDQPRAKRPGSATVRLADALGVKEHGTGEKPG